MSRSRQIPLWPVVVVTAAGLAAATFVASRYIRAGAEQAARLARLESDNRKLRAASEESARQANSLRENLASSGSAAAPAELPRQRMAAPIDALEQAKMLYQFRDKLSSANAAIAGLQDRIQELEANIQRSAEENKRLAASEAELKTRVASSVRVLSAVKDELGAKEQRLSQLESANLKLREENRANTDKLSQISRLLRDLDEINRRRETYLASMLRRYKDATEQYRALSARIENPPDMSRIADSLAMAEEDMRQLVSLNAQASRLQQRLGK